MEGGDEGAGVRIAFLVIEAETGGLMETLVLRRPETGADMKPGGRVSVGEVVIDVGGNGLAVGVPGQCAVGFPADAEVLVFWFEDRIAVLIARLEELAVDLSRGAGEDGKADFTLDAPGALDALGSGAADDLGGGVPHQECEVLFGIDGKVGANAGDTGARQEAIVGVACDVGVIFGAAGDGVIPEAEAGSGGREAHEDGLWLGRAGARSYSVPPVDD